MPTPRNQWGVAPWDRDGPIAVRDLCDIPKHLDVAIVGAGLTGLSTAYHLAKLGVRSVVLEAGIVADGASGRTGGLVLEGTAAGPLASVDSCVAGLRKLVTAEQIDCGLQLPGCWEIEHRREPSSSTPDSSILPWTDAGKRIAIAKLVAGGTVEPARLTLGLARAAVVAGVSIYENAKVTDIRINYPSGKPSADAAAVHNLPSKVEMKYLAPSIYRSRLRVKSFTSDGPSSPPMPGSVRSCPLLPPLHRMSLTVRAPIAGLLLRAILPQYRVALRSPAQPNLYPSRDCMK